MALTPREIHIFDQLAAELEPGRHGGTLLRLRQLAADAAVMLGVALGWLGLGRVFYAFDSGQVRGALALQSVGMTMILLGYLLTGEEDSPDRVSCRPRRGNRAFPKRRG